MKFHFYHLKDATQSNNVSLLKGLQNESGWGAFSGAFGIATNEMYWVTNEGVDNLAIQDRVIGRCDLTATVRPTDDKPLTKPGLYVFRWFEVDVQHTDEVVRLSNEAWQTFEGGFDTEVQGLFTTNGFKVGGIEPSMLLITWYRDLATWQESRAPDPKARKRFLARQALMKSALPIATRLEVPHV